MSTAANLHVLELGDSVASAYAAKLLADHGADVIKVEPTTGDQTRHRGPFPNDVPNPENSGLFLAINVNKRGICLDLTIPADLETLKRLIHWADILVHSFAAEQAQILGLSYAQLQSSSPQLVVLAITPFGSVGPYADFEATEITLANAGGWAYVCPATQTDTTLAPLKVFGSQCGLMTGITGAMTALAVYRDACQTGIGDFIDLSQQSYVASVLEVGVPAYSYMGDVPARYHQRSIIPWRIFQAKDAAVFIVCVEQDQWLRLVEFMGQPDWADIELFADPAGRAENQDLIHNFVQQFVAGWNVMELYHAAQKHRICVAPVLDFKKFGHNEHLASREFFTDLKENSGLAVKHIRSAILTTQGRSAIRRPAPRLGEHTDEILTNLIASEKANETANETASKTIPSSDKKPISQPASVQTPLQGIRVLDLTWAWAGPFATMNLAYLGAEVIRLESAVRPDLYRRLPIFPPDIKDPGLNCAGMFNQWNQGKSSIAVDLQDPQGIEIVKSFVAESDVIIQNFATGVMDRLGLGYATLRAINPGIILASISGYGQTGPYRDYMGYGPAIPPLTGLSAVTGYVDGAAEEFGLSMPDPTAGITAAWAVVAALHNREQTGQGEHLDISLWEATGVLAVEGWMQFAINGTQPPRMGNRDAWMSPHGCFACKGDDAWISIACRTDQEWQTLARLIDPELATDNRFSTLEARKNHEANLETLISSWTSKQDRWQLTNQLQALKIAAFPSFSAADIVEDPHLARRGFIERLDHPEVGRRPTTGIPWMLKQRPARISRPAPCLGEDSSRLLADVLGYSTAKIATLRKTGVLH
ncbi:MAG: CoA transferase [Pseudomonadales bacterium]|nr:CoA transferase [Pseudomonadales bacterium]